MSVLMRICLDIQSAVTQRAGVGRYTASLVEHLGSCSNDIELVLPYFDFTGKASPPPANGAVLKPIRLAPGRAVQYAWRTLGWPPFDLLAGSADLYHFPNFTLPPLSKGKSVVTIHDMSFIRFPEYAEEKNLLNLTAMIKDTAARSDAIITVSEFSRREVIELLGADESRVFAIHSGISQRFRRHSGVPEKVLEWLGLTRPYILTVGTLEPRKNIPFLVDVFERLESFDGDLVIAGMDGWKCEPIKRRIAESSKSDRIKRISFVEDDELTALYAGAELFAFPSFYEGFGFPPLEAMACGTPVISSRGGSLEEVLGDGAMLMETFNIEEWISAINRVMDDPNGRKTLAEAGRDWSARYSWRETARETWDLYMRILAGRES